MSRNTARLQWPNIFGLPSPRIKRIIPASLACLIVLATVIQIVQPFMSQERYDLSASAKSLVGQSRDDTKDYLKLNQTKTAYEFAVPQPADANSEFTGRNTAAYESVLSLNAKDGVTFTDTATKIGVNIKPNFATADGRKISGDQIVYPTGADQLVYTHKYNGLKEDIIVPRYRSDNLSYKFELQLPSGVEARLDSQGNIGIYSSDPLLFGNISFGTDDDRLKIDKARETSEKTNLVMTIPFPVVKDSTGQEFTDRAKFELGEKRSQQITVSQEQESLPPEVKQQAETKRSVNEYSLTLKAFNLKELAYPISLDPTMQVTNAADFNQLNLEGGAEIDTSNSLIKRTSLTGGSLENWASAGSGLTARYGAAAVALNGYMYVTGGCITNQVVTNVCSAVTNVVQKATITSSGIGAWTTETALPGNLWQHTMVTYNGFIYAISGGYDTLPQGNPNIYRIKVNANGTLAASWITTPAICCQLYSTSFVYNGYMYRLGGHASGALTSTVLYSKLNGDGSFGTWTATTSMPTALSDATTSVYNGRVYVTGGCINTNPCSAYTNAVVSARLNTDGTISSWSTQNSFTTARRGALSWVQAGYLYVGGGQATSSFSDVQYSPIHADGNIGTWTTVTSLLTARDHYSGVVSGGYLYLAGGQNSGTILATSEYTTTKPAGYPGAWSTLTSNAQARSYAAVAAYRGKIYVTGGCTDNASTSGSADTCNTASSNIEYGTINNSTGAITWQGSTTTTGMPAALWGHRFVMHNGRAYVTGGCTVGLFGACAMSTTAYDIDVTTIGNIDTGTWNLQLNAVDARMVHGFEIYNNIAYVAGGYNGTNGLASTQYKVLNPDGSIPSGAWSAGPSLPNIRGFIDMVAYGGFMYIAGGSSGRGGAAYNTIIYAAIDPITGLLNGWTTNSVTLTTAVFDTSLVAANGYLYVMNRGVGNQQYGKVNTDGSVVNPNGSGAAIATFADFPTAHATSDATVFVNGYMYAVGGCTSTTGTNGYDCTTATTNVHMAPLNNGGTGNTSAWSSANILVQSTTAATSFAANGKLWVIGGADSSAVAQAVTQFATINGDGTLSAFSLGPNLLTAVTRHSGAYVNGFVYAIAGTNATGALTATVQYAKVMDDGSLSSNSCGTLVAWCTTTAAFPTACNLHQSTSYNGFIYTTGGCTSSEIKIAQPNSTTGDITSWQSGPNLPDTRYWGPAMVAYSGYLYMLGGCSSGSCVGPLAENMYNSVLVATINADGSLGAPTYTSSFNLKRRVPQAVASNGFMYLISGDGASNSVDYAPILTGGKLGVWQSTASTPGNLSGHTAAYFNGRLYATMSTTVYTANIAALPRSGNLSKLYDFDVGVKPTKLVTRGTKQSGAAVAVGYTTSNGSIATLDNLQSILSTGYNGANAQTLSLGAGRTLSRYLFLKYTIDDSQSAVFPDGGKESTITDFDLYFTPNPGNRLRGGQTFTGGQSRGLDAP